MATPRRLQVDPSVSGIYHCHSRCVRRAFLCGQDSHSGRNFDHRRGWIRDRIRELTALFAIEVDSYDVMSNHFHVVVRTLPERVAGWTDAEVARRWLSLYPGPKGRSGVPPTESAIAELCADTQKLATCRARLADLSWFMRALKEPIARRANREDGCTGHFWEGRFKCQKLEDEGAVLACMIYVELNAVRAGMASSLEEIEFASIQDRLIALGARRQLARVRTLSDPTPEQAELIARAEREATRDHWLAPIGESRDSGPDDPPPLLPLEEEQYLQLVEWTGQQIRGEGKHGHLRSDLCSVLERLDLRVETWAANVAQYEGLFCQVAGNRGDLHAFARATGRAWVHGQKGARRLYSKVR